MPKQFSFLAWLAALALLGLSITHARADPPPAPAVRVFSCSFGYGVIGCVRRYGRPNPHVINVPQPTADDERTASEARDKAWMARCRPTFQQDKYGMPRYRYAAPGCEFGMLN
jgi:hypothetical protein